MSDQYLHYGKPIDWLLLNDVWFKCTTSSAFIVPADINEQPVYSDNEVIDSAEIIKFRKKFCKKFLSDYVKDLQPDDKEIVKAKVAVSNCPDMVDDYRFVAYTEESRNTCECLALFDIFSSLKDPVGFLQSMAVGQRLVMTINVVPTNIWQRNSKWKRKATWLPSWIHYKHGFYQSYFTLIGLRKLLENTGFKILGETDDEAIGMGGMPPNEDQKIQRSWDRRIDAYTIAVVKMKGDDE